MENNFLSISKIAFLWLFSTSFCNAQQSENWTEKDWVNYAKAQGNSFEFTLKSLKNIMADKEYGDYLDSMARVDIFKSLFYNGVEIRKVEIKPPVLTGTVSYYFLDGKLASQAEFASGVANGKCIYYYPNGNIYKKEVYKNGVPYARDTIQTFSTKGQLIGMEIETDSSYLERRYSYDEGKLLAEAFLHKKKLTVDTISEKFFDLESKTVETRVSPNLNNYFKFYNYNGKKISAAKGFIILMKEEKNHPFEEHAAFPKSRRENVEQTENELFNSYYRKVKMKRMRVFIELQIGESYKSCANYELLKEITSNANAFSSHMNYPHSPLLDTLFCEPQNQVLRMAQTKNGKLHGELKYFYPSGKLLALLNFNEDYPEGDFKFYYPTGDIKKRSKYKKGVAIDSTFEFTNNNLLKTLTVWEDSVKYIKRTYWEDGKTLQQMEQCTGEILDLQILYGLRQVNSKEITEKRYYNKLGEEISKKQFEKDYPKILPKIFTRAKSKS